MRKGFGKSYSLEKSLRESIFREDPFSYNCLQPEEREGGAAEAVEQPLGAEKEFLRRLRLGAGGRQVHHLRAHHLHEQPRRRLQLKLQPEVGSCWILGHIAMITYIRGFLMDLNQDPESPKRLKI